MLQAIEAIVEPNGTIHPLEAIGATAPMRAIVTLLEPLAFPVSETQPQKGSATALLALLQTPRFAHRPPADPEEVQQRIQALRNDWDED